MIENKKAKTRNRLRYCRMTSNMKQQDIAYLMELESTVISKWEQGERLPGIYNAIGLAIATGCLVEDVFYDFWKEWQERILKRRKLLSAVEKAGESSSYTQKVNKKDF